MMNQKGMKTLIGKLKRQTRLYVMWINGPIPSVKMNVRRINYEYVNLIFVAQGSIQWSGFYENGDEEQK
jgi:hypothetical protein